MALNLVLGFRAPGPRGKHTGETIVQVDAKVKGQRWATVRPRRGAAAQPTEALMERKKSRPGTLGPVRGLPEV